MSKPVQNFIVGVRHGGDTRYVTETVIVGAKSKKDAIQYAKTEKGKHHHYSSRGAELTPTVRLSEGAVAKRSRNSSPFVEIQGEIYLETDETRNTHSINPEGKPVLTIERKYVKRFARKASDCLWQPTSVVLGEESIRAYLARKPLLHRTPKQLTHHPMKSRT